LEGIVELITETNPENAAYLLTKQHKLGHLLGLAADVLAGRTKAPSVARFLEAVNRAEGLVLATPVYKATYSGALKAVVDLIAQDALVGRKAIGIATTKLAAHGVEVAAAYRALFAFFRLAHGETLVLLDSEITIDAHGGSLSADAGGRLALATDALVKS
jgi:FMN reductase